MSYADISWGFPEPELTMEPAMAHESWKEYMGYPSEGLTGAVCWKFYCLLDISSLTLPRLLLFISLEKPLAP